MSLSRKPEGMRKPMRYKMDKGEGFNNWGGRGYDDFVPGVPIDPQWEETSAPTPYS